MFFVQNTGCEIQEHTDYLPDLACKNANCKIVFDESDDNGSTYILVGRAPTTLFCYRIGPNALSSRRLVEK